MSDLQEKLIHCCGSSKWVAAMMKRAPFVDESAMVSAADEIWNGLEDSDWKEAFLHHPKIGDLESLRKKFATTEHLTSQEQSGVQGAHEDVLAGLAKGNADYEAKFGYLFIVCATGKSASEMLSLLEERLKNDSETEIQVAMTEQAKITKIRIHKVFYEGQS